MRIEGIAAIVTGGGSGLGRAVVEALAARGARVAVLDRDADAAAAVAAAAGGIAAACDVADAATTEAAFAAATAAHGVARIVVHCAGIGTAGRIVGRDGPQPLAAFEAVVRVNLVGTFNVLRLAAAAMASLAPLDDGAFAAEPGRDQEGERGAIVTTASVAAFEGQIGQAAYAASKAGVVGLTLPAARELARFGIRVNTIAPGLFRTPLLDGLPDEARTAIAAAIPFPARLGAPAEFAALALHLIENPFLNGETVRLDGALRLAPR
jgi:NAD(P)-dependent dehydrogenase (short-subunit alcohol dehydrogenase family)